MRMMVEYVDGEIVVFHEENEQLCICTANQHADEHGDIVNCSEIEEDSILYPYDGWQQNQDLENYQEETSNEHTNLSN